MFICIFASLNTLCKLSSNILETLIAQYIFMFFQRLFLIPVQFEAFIRYYLLNIIIVTLDSLGKTEIRFVTVQFSSIFTT